jgi:hypothetical protein
MSRVLRKLVAATILLVIAAAIYDLTQPDSPIANLVHSIRVDGPAEAIGRSMRSLINSMSFLRK